MANGPAREVANGPAQSRDIRLKSGARLGRDPDFYRHISLFAVVCGPGAWQEVPLSGAWSRRFKGSWALGADSSWLWQEVPLSGVRSRSVAYCPGWWRTVPLSGILSRAVAYGPG